MKESKWTQVREAKLETNVFDAYMLDGETSGLLILADACDENAEGVGHRPHFAKLLRHVGLSNNPAVHWFFLNGEHSYNKDVETQCQGRLRCAATAAWFEARWIERTSEDKWRFRWFIDGEDEGTIDDDGNMRDSWTCILEEREPLPDKREAPRVVGHAQDDEAWRTIRGWRHLESLGGIDLGDHFPPAAYTGMMDGDVDTPAPYSRVVMARLAMMAGDHCPHSYELPPAPEWCGIEVPRRKVLGVFRNAEDTNQDSQHWWHPIQQGKVVVCFPCEPAEAAYSHDVRGACEGYFMHEGKLMDTFYVHADLMYRSYRANPVLQGEAIAELTAALATKGIDVTWVETAPAGYRKIYAEKYNQGVEDRIPF